jgi:RNA polymerase sigma-70 factor (ECF subfamily)
MIALDSQALAESLVSHGSGRQRMTDARRTKGAGTAQPPRPGTDASTGPLAGVLPAVATEPPGAPSAGEIPGAAAALASAADDLTIRRVKNGDVNAFEELVRRYGTRVGRAVARHVPREQREEVVQDTWVRAFQSLDGFRPGSRFGDWLTGIAVRASYDYWRQHYRRREVPESALGDSHREWIESAGAAQSAEEFRVRVAQEEARELLRYALAQVSAEDRMVVSLVHLEGLSAREAARLLGWTVANVKVRAHRSRRRMRQALENWLEKETR